MKKIEWPLLGPNDIEVRIATCKDGKTTLLLYQNSRTAMDALDNTVGEMGWQITYKAVNDKVYGELSIWDDEKNQWITKADTGEESNISADKGQSSDILKRCAVRFGFARELYTTPRIVINNDNKFAKYYVSDISYSGDRKINGLTIVDYFGNIAYRYGISSSVNDEIASATNTDELKAVWDNHKDLQNDGTFKTMVSGRKNELKNE